MRLALDGAGGVRRATALRFERPDRTRHDVALHATASVLVAHWTRSSTAERCSPRPHEALAQACRCDCIATPSATLDSAWHAGLVDEAASPRSFGAAASPLPSPARRAGPRSDSGARRSCASSCAVSASTSSRGNRAGVRTGRHGDRTDGSSSSATVGPRTSSKARGSRVDSGRSRTAICAILRRWATRRVRPIVEDDPSLGDADRRMRHEAHPGAPPGLPTPRSVALARSKPSAISSMSSSRSSTGRNAPAAALSWKVSRSSRSYSKVSTSSASSRVSDVRLIVRLSTFTVTEKPSW